MRFCEYDNEETRSVEENSLLWSHLHIISLQSQNTFFFLNRPLNNNETYLLLNLHSIHKVSIHIFPNTIQAHSSHIHCHYSNHTQLAHEIITQKHVTVLTPAPFSFSAPLQLNSIWNFVYKLKEKTEHRNRVELQQPWRLVRKALACCLGQADLSECPTPPHRPRTWTNAPFPQNQFLYAWSVLHPQWRQVCWVLYTRGELISSRNNAF